jgi:hypothetical protein
MVIVGLMKDPHEARGAVRALRDSGFTLEEIDTQGSLAECLSEIGVPEGEIGVYAEGIRRGGTLVGVAAHNEVEAENAAYIMAEHGAVDLAACAQSWGTASVELLFGELPNGPGRVYKDARVGRARGRTASNESRYAGPERRHGNQPYTGINRRAA